MEFVTPGLLHSKYGQPLGEGTSFGEKLGSVMLPSSF